MNFYRYTHGLIQRVTWIDENDITRISPFNIGLENAYGLESDISFEPLDWWNFSNNLNIYRSEIAGNSEVDNLNSDTWTLRNRITSKMKIIYGIDFQLNLDYRAPRNVPQGKIKEIWWVDFGLSKDFYNNSMTVTFSGNDIFDTRRRRMTTYGDDFLFDQDFNWRSGSFTLSFSYRYNQGKESKPL